MKLGLLHCWVVPSGNPVSLVRDVSHSLRLGGELFVAGVVAAKLRRRWVVCNVRRKVLHDLLLTGRPPSMFACASHPRPQCSFPCQVCMLAMELPWARHVFRPMACRRWVQSSVFLFSIVPARCAVVLFKERPLSWLISPSYSHTAACTCVRHMNWRGEFKFWSKNLGIKQYS